MSNETYLCRGVLVGDRKRLQVLCRKVFAVPEPIRRAVTAISWGVTAARFVRLSLLIAESAQWRLPPHRGA